MKAYAVLKLMHVVAAVVWVGGGVTINVLGTRSLSRDPSRGLEFIRDVDWMGKRVYLPASLATLLFGVLAALQGRHDLRSIWLVVGIAGVLVTTLTGTLFFLPEGQRILTIGRRRGAGDPEVQYRTTRLMAIARLDLVVLLLVVVDMVLKPGS